MRINQNIMALNAYRNLSASNSAMSKTLEKLSSGSRINRAADDASGLVISQNLRAQIGGLRQATRNAQDGISVVQTAEGALNEVHNMLGRMRDLAVQASNTGSNDADARSAAQKEVVQLREEINRIGNTTKFGSVDLLKGDYGVTNAKFTTSAIADVSADITLTANDTFTVKVGTGAAVTVTVNATPKDAGEHAAWLQDNIKSALYASGQGAAADGLKVTLNKAATGTGGTISIEANQNTVLAAGTGTPLTALGFTAGTQNTSGTGGVFQVGSKAGTNEQISLTIGDMRTAALGIDAVDLSTGAGASSAITSIDTAIATVSTNRGDLGAKQNRFESVIANLQVSVENLASSESRIRDTDYAMEMVSYTRGQIMNQVGTAMLGQANQLPQSVTQLLR
jgi:flagellin